MNEVHAKLGKLLKLERERKDIKLDDLSESLKISEEHLTHIETGESDKLPAELYFKLFAKAYAEALGIDFEATMQAIQEDIAEQKAAQVPPEKERARKAAEAARKEEEAKYGFRKKLILLFGGIIVALIAFVILFRFLAGGPPEAERGTDTPGDVSEGATDAALASYTFGEPPSEAPEPITMTLRAREESWATILADGDTVIFRSLVPWKEYTVEAEHRIIASVAHPRLVDIGLNGTPVNLRDPATRRISRVQIDQVNIAELIARGMTEEPAPQPTREAEPASPEPAQTETSTTRADETETDGQGITRQSLGQPTDNQTAVEDASSPVVDTPEVTDEEEP
ncbi:helix-turn-helix domain-containing protein [candidate division GN15 bacterium]|nr:helix-turn-helix domain-containing protein [candidate division GN15 bacterium]